MTGFEYIFPSIRGVQAGHEYYAAMCPIRLIPRILVFDEIDMRPELRAQRILNKQRVPEICKYLVDNPRNYILSSLTASIDGKVVFEPYGNSADNNSIGHLRIPMNARIILNDGQHRRAAIEAALQKNPNLGDETISIVFFVDTGLKRCQQMFADLNRYAIRPAASLGILYDHRAEAAEITRNVVSRISVFQELTEFERSSISNRSRKLFTLSGIHKANLLLLAGHNIDFDSVEKRIETSVWFWGIVSDAILDWNDAMQGNVASYELRQVYIHSHALGLASIARVGNSILSEKRKTVEQSIKQLRNIDWRRDAKHWAGRIGSAGRLAKNNINILLTANWIKKKLGIKLTPEESKEEKKFKEDRT